MIVCTIQNLWSCCVVSIRGGRGPGNRAHKWTNDSDFDLGVDLGFSKWGFLDEPVSQQAASRRGYLNEATSLKIFSRVLAPCIKKWINFNKWQLVETLVDIGMHRLHFVAMKSVLFLPWQCENWAAFSWKTKFLRRTHKVCFHTWWACTAHTCLVLHGQSLGVFCHHTFWFFLYLLPWTWARVFFHPTWCSPKWSWPSQISPR